MQEYEYDVTLSFAGEDRKHAEALASFLKNDGYKVFYDKYEWARLWGENLYDEFSAVYKDKARYCVMFVSEHYARKLWTNHERQSAQARAFQESEAYILPILLDDTEIPGILPTVGHLDLRSMSIEDVYSALLEKLQAGSSQTTINPSTSTSVENNVGEFVLLRSANGSLRFLPFIEARRDSTGISLKVLSESSEDAGFLRSLRDTYNDVLAFAHKVDAAWVSLEEIVETTAGSQTVCEVRFNVNDSRANYDFFGDMTVMGISADQIAEMRARRILLDEKLDVGISALSQDNFSDIGQRATLYTENASGVRSFLGQVDTWELDLLEAHIHGMSSSGYEPGLPVEASPIPELYRQFGETPEKFKKFAHLISVLYLKLSNTIEDILKLDLELLGPAQLRVNFKGRRPQFAVNEAPSIIEFEGSCPLSK